MLKKGIGFTLKQNHFTPKQNHVRLLPIKIEQNTANTLMHIHFSNK
ncbi:hypothetical protein QE382_002819 [Sphingobacterium zeae]|uniref:Uncharacterized protein n=1 Tax=Sphingobacterium zeae TaxID=1776859 RepID=A0ABU0U7D6_9SPHI|nr:hypothetical protein [Sphingobacterium zeae]